ncbi:hypothetical protein LDO32_18465 [Luteimonas sp. Y-2-2-4F]|nr:hypothetical protein [Luteimonas sp. Y-2-2-4F]MCD9033699.1 hypothetical protein [Luteimonas sp. Y-2-2-4F]
MTAITADAMRVRPNAYADLRRTSAIFERTSPRRAMMARARISILAGLVLAASAAATPEKAAAADLTNAVLECYVDTYAFDVPTPNYCVSWWTPGSANNPTLALFEVTGLPAGSYSFAWTDLDTGSPPPGCGNVQYCSTGIATDTSGDGSVRLSVLVTDLTTGLTRTLTAEAYYYDAWT